MNRYLVQYSQWNRGVILEAENPKNAVHQVINGEGHFSKDNRFPFKVFLLEDGREFSVDTKQTVKEI